MHPPTLRDPAEEPDDVARCNQGATIGSILLAMAVVALVGQPCPFIGRAASRAISANMALTFITFATNLFLNTTLVMSLMVLSASALAC